MKRNTIYIIFAALIGMIMGYVITGILNTGESENHNHEAEVNSDQMWTCSMHPQIMQKEAGDCPLCGMDLIPAEIDDDGLSPDAFKMSRNAMELANIQTTIVGGGNLDSSNHLSVTGTIKRNEESNAVQASYFDGRIEKLNVNYVGQIIRKGQLLAKIFSPNLIAAQQELLSAISLKTSQPELYKAVRNKLKLWKLTENQINEIESSGTAIEYFPIYATVSGTVSEVISAEGDYVKQGQPILRVSDLKTVWAEFDVYENQISLFKIGQKINIIPMAHSHESIQAEISFIDPILDSRTRTMTIRTVLDNRDDALKPGMFITGTVALPESADQEITVPSSAVMWTGERSVVYIKRSPEEPIFEMREVKVGRINDNSTTIISGLQNGDEVVVNGTFTVDAAAQLMGKKSMMNRGGGSSSTGHEDHMKM
ncbi:MAG: efflux RND transporter periplasmic adaptor subunit [Flavobacteriaceae bacterium]